MWSRYISLYYCALYTCINKITNIRLWLREVWFFFFHSCCYSNIFFFILLLLFCFVIITSVSLMESFSVFFGYHIPSLFHLLFNCESVFLFIVPLHIGYDQTYLYTGKIKPATCDWNSKWVPVLFLLLSTILNVLNGKEWAKEHQRSNNDICNPYYFICILYLLIKKSRRNTDKTNEIYSECWRTILLNCDAYIMMIYKTIVVVVV